MDRIDGKTCLVTGATSGIGKATAAALSDLGATVVLLARDPSRGERAMADTHLATGAGTLELLIGDLASMASVRQAVAAFKDRHLRLDVLVNCAAVFKSKREVTPDGLELMFATNYLGPFLLTNLLLDVMKASVPARVLNLTAPSTVPLVLDDLQSERRFRALHAFGATKMGNLIFTFALARRLAGTGVTVNAVHPGLVRSSLMREAPAPLRWITRAMSATPEKAARAIVDVAAAPEFAEKTGCFFHDGKSITASAYAYDQEVQERLWAASSRLSGLEL